MTTCAATENQGAAWWGILVTDLGQPDPPTVYRPDNGAGWEPWSDRLSVALADLVMAETVRYGRDRLSDAADLRDEVLAVFEPLPTLLPDGCESKWFAGDDLLLHLLGDYWMSVRARTPEALETLYENVYAEWING